MTVKRFKKLWILVAALIVTASFSLPMCFTAYANNVSVGSSLFKDIDNVSVTPSGNGLKLSATGISSAGATYANKLYLSDFSFKYTVTENNFSYITFTFISANKDNTYSGTIKDIENVLKISKDSKGKLTAKLNDMQEIVTAQDFTALTEINFNAGADKISVKGTAAEFALTSPEFKEASLKINFYGVMVTKTAGIVIKEINGQSFLSASGNVQDNIKPVMRLNTERLNGFSPLCMQYELPLYGLDVISSNIKYEIVLNYSADGTTYDQEDITKTSVKFPLEKLGYYKVKSITVKDNNGNETSECADRNISDNPIIIKTEKWDDNSRPVINSFETENLAAYLSGIPMAAAGGKDNKFQFKTPETIITSAPAGVTENANLIKYELLYKTSGVSSWSKNDGLIFTASSKGEYWFKIQGIDRIGNRSDLELSPLIKISFTDITSPKITVSGFPSEKYAGQSLTLPSGSITDDMDSSPEKSIKVYYIMDEEGKSADEKELVSETYSFTPDKTGWYEAVYSAKDSSGNKATYAPMTFKVVKAAESPKTEPFIDFTDTWTIVSASVAAASALGIIILLFIKPKDEEK